MSHRWDDATDAELLSACHGEQEPFAVFYRRHERLVASWLMRRCEHVDVAGDLVAEVFAAAYIAAPRFKRRPEPAQAWLLGIARNKLLRTLRRDRIEASARRRLQMDTVALSEESAATLLTLGEIDPIELLADLPVEQREAVRGRILEDLDYQELAARMSVTQAVARKRVSRGLGGLRRLLQSEGAQR